MFSMIADERIHSPGRHESASVHGGVRVKSWSSFVVGFVLGVAVAAVLFYVLPRERGRTAVAAAPGGGAATTKSGQQQAAQQPSGDVIINGKSFTQRHKDEFVQRYGVAPIPGSYWYDTRSGLWGLAGQAAAGFLFAGHDYGALAANASNGDTGVFLNGREMPQGEVLVFASLVGPILPGRYWLDGQGSYGYEGMAIPVGNLYVMAAAASSGGGGGGGDNFWSSRFARGNSNADNSMGYVSIPGTGTVTYGM